MDFPTRLRRLRHQKKMTQQELGRRINVTKVSISGYENGNRTPDMETLQKIADVFEVSVDYLLGRTDDPHQVLSDGVRVFVDSLELTDDEILDKIKLTIDGRELTPEEAKRFIAFVRAERSLRNK